ncbi:MAG TPA: hypothetical protein VLH08_07930, partial [Acidobacteriota bacterium]|nr:hypothetical protein [Acidobacteriota bacterium]
MSRVAKVGLAVIVLIVVAGIVGFLALRAFEPKLRADLIRAIEERFDAKAEIKTLDISLFPRTNISGTGLVLWYKGRHDIPPLIKLDEFSAHATLRELFQKPRRIAEVNLKGLAIQIPPGEDNDNDEIEDRKSQNDAKPAPVTEPSKIAKRPIPHFVIARLYADGSELKILPKDPDKDPLEFKMYRLTLNALGVDRPLQYDAMLKNAKPPGMITSKGEIGPWNTPDPAGTPVSGIYKFRNADLSIFKGISGTLASDGQFKGVLKRIEVDGNTDTPNFMVQIGKQPVHLKTKFHAIVDGTKGDTLLQPVVATFGKTTINCEGAVIKKKGLSGKSVILNVRVRDGRIEDILKFVVTGKAPVVGAIRFTSKMELPPGDVDVIKKLRLSGGFGVDDARFTTSTVQEKIEDLSYKSRGKLDEEEQDERVVSDLKGDFVIGNGTASFSKLAFMVPGAAVNLEGTYDMVNTNIDFEGTLRMQA